jgi:hypothetical protein
MDEDVDRRLWPKNLFHGRIGPGSPHSIVQRHLKMFVVSMFAETQPAAVQFLAQLRHRPGTSLIAHFRS